MIITAREDLKPSGKTTDHMRAMVGEGLPETPRFRDGKPEGEELGELDMPDELQNLLDH